MMPDPRSARPFIPAQDQRRNPSRQQVGTQRQAERGRDGGGDHEDTPDTVRVWESTRIRARNKTSKRENPAHTRTHAQMHTHTRIQKRQVCFRNGRTERTCWRITCVRWSVSACRAALLAPAVCAQQFYPEPGS